MRRISAEQGLSSDKVFAITQDREGFIWIGTDNGLNRYDGQNVVVYKHTADTNSVNSSYISSLCVDREGTLWVGTGDGLDRFNPVNRSFKHYFHDPRVPSTLSENGINAIYEDRGGVLWVGTRRGLNRFERETDTWQSFLPTVGASSKPGDNSVGAILEDHKGRFWIGSGGWLMSGGGLRTFDRATKTFSRPVQEPPGQGRQYPDQWITSISEDVSGTVWVCRDHADLKWVNPHSWMYTNVLLPTDGSNFLGRLALKCVREDTHGALWVATWGAGLYRYNQRQGKFSRYAFNPLDPGSIPSLAINTLFIDRAGLLWVGTNWRGACTVSTKPFLHRHDFGNSLHIDSQVSALLTDRQGTIWFNAFGLGVQRYDPRTQTATSIAPNTVSVMVFQDSTGKVWFDNVREIRTYDPATGKTELVTTLPPQPGAGEATTYMHLDRKGLLWVGGYVSLYRYDRALKQWTHFTYDPNDSRSITHGFVTGILEDSRGALWVSNFSGLNRFEPATQSFTRFQRDENDPSSLSNNRVLSLLEDRSGTLWVGTGDGLNRFDSRTSTFSRFSPLHPRAGRSVSHLMEDDRGRLWYASEAGISSFDPAHGTFQEFDRSDGVEPATAPGWVGIKLPDGEFAYGTASGLVVFHPDSLSYSPTVPPVVITGMRSPNHTFPLAMASGHFRHVNLEHQDNVFTVEFAALSFDMPEFNQYAYMLEGFDKDWVDCGNQRSAMYTNLDPGTYTFHVKGSNHDGVWNNAGSSLTIVVDPAFWQTWWFRLLAGGALLSLIGFAYRHEVSRLQKEKYLQEDFSRKLIETQETGRKGLASELHDGLGQDLLVAGNELQQFLQTERGPAEEVKRAAVLVQESIQNVRDIASMLHPHYLDRLGLSAAVEVMTTNVAHASGLAIDCRCEKVDGLLPKEMEIHLYRIIQEALSNVVRHAHAAKASVCIHESTDGVEVTITDDGAGFLVESGAARNFFSVKEEGIHGFGLSSMTERARIIGGTLRVASSPGSGTTIHLTVPHP